MTGGRLLAKSLKWSEKNQDPKRKEKNETRVARENEPAPKEKSESREDEPDSLLRSERKEEDSEFGRPVVTWSVEMAGKGPPKHPNFRDSFGNFLDPEGRRSQRGKDVVGLARSLDDSQDRRDVLPIESSVYHTAPRAAQGCLFGPAVPWKMSRVTAWLL